MHGYILVVDLGEDTMGRARLLYPKRGKMTAPLAVGAKDRRMLDHSKAPFPESHMKEEEVDQLRYRD